MEVKEFDITKKEKIEYGKYSRLKSVLNNYLSDLETFFFDKFSIPFQITYEVVTNTKFNDFYEELTDGYLPIVTFTMPPLKGSSLLVIDNQLANLLLTKDSIEKLPEIKASDQFKFIEENKENLRLIVKDLFAYLEKEWRAIFNLKCDLQKIVSHKIKAKVLKPYEPCILIPFHFKKKNFSAKMIFCFSNIQLDPITYQVKSEGLLPDLNFTASYPENKKHFNDILLKNDYEVSASLGKITQTKEELLNSLQEGMVLPIENELDSDLKININGTPIYSAELGSTQDNFSAKILKKYEKETEKGNSKQKQFTKMQFKKG